MNRAECERIAASANRLRPDWRFDSLVTFLAGNFSDRPAWDVARALVWIAMEPGAHPGEYVNRTPRLMLEAGPWWSSQIPPSTMDETPVPIGWCSLHRSEDSQRRPCRECIAERGNVVTDPVRIQEIRAEARKAVS